MDQRFKVEGNQGMIPAKAITLNLRLYSLFDFSMQYLVSNTLILCTMCTILPYKIANFYRALDWVDPNGSKWREIRKKIPPRPSCCHFLSTNLNETNKNLKSLILKITLSSLSISGWGLGCVGVCDTSDC